MTVMTKFFLPFLVFFIHLNAHAATVITLSLSDLVAEADDVVVARCVGLESRWQGTKIVTDSVFDVSEPIKGNAGATLKIMALGGTAIHPILKAPVTMSVSGGVVFELDQESLLFTKVDSAGNNQVIGLTQGKFAIEVDPQSGKKVISVGQKVLSSEGGDIASLDYFFSPSSVFEKPGDRIEIRKMELTELIHRIQESMAAKP